MTYKETLIQKEIEATLQLHEAEALFQEHGIEILKSDCSRTYIGFFSITIEVCDRYVFYKYCNNGINNDDVWTLFGAGADKYGTLKELMLKWKNRPKVMI